MTRNLFIGFNFKKVAVLSDIRPRLLAAYNPSARTTHRKHFDRIVAWRVCWNVSTEPLPINAFSKSITVS
jgi:hypothetical protein